MSYLVRTRFLPSVVKARPKQSCLNTIERRYNKWTNLKPFPKNWILMSKLASRQFIVHHLTTARTPRIGLMAVGAIPTTVGLTAVGAIPTTVGLTAVGIIPMTVGQTEAGIIPMIVGQTAVGTMTAANNNLIKVAALF